jgi:anthranilate synthase/aminodeoxychorismate synthase-like glutamine amidotransferase
MLIIIDNYDSFTYNIVQTIAGQDDFTDELVVLRNDKVDIKGLEELAPDRLLISPGPCTPDEAGISIAAIKHFAGKIPILGVCLGHQAIGQAFGGKVVRAGRVMHGKTSPVSHDNKGVFNGLPDPFAAMRYHSLIVDDSSLPDCLEVSARTDQGELMGIRHKTLMVEGVQFHPESIMTPDGIRLLKNFVSSDYTLDRR